MEKDVKSAIIAQVARFEGDTGPYVQYVAARINSISRKAAESGIDLAKADWSRLGHEFEKELAVKLYFYPAQLKLCAERRDCSGLVEYLLDLCKCFNRFYRECPVVSIAAQDAELAASRLALAKAVHRVVSDGLATLTIGVPEAM